jgi:hydroxymethylpyrimidine pyrophosphatase-like HAD family hydrolase
VWFVSSLENPRDFFVNTKENWLKALVTGNSTAVKYLSEKYKDEYSISFSHSENIEVNAKGVSKGEAIKALCEILNININDTLCFGDSGNDIEMFKVVGVPVVMGNSEIEELHNLAKYKALNYDELGVYHFLREHF